jgi:hypothetical protein
MNVHGHCNRDRDRAMTLLVIEGRWPEVETGAQTNWLGHEVGSGAAALDHLLLKGGTLAGMKQERGAVENHLRHLRQDHGLPIYTTPRENKFEFDYLVLGANRSTAG